LKRVAVGFIFLALGMVSCKQNTEIAESKGEYEIFGAEIEQDKVTFSQEEMLHQYQNLKEGDTLNVKFLADINEVCQKKGCWMNVDLGEGHKSFVRFTDYGFFAPKNAAGHKVIVDGKAFLSVVSVDELKHYAKDAGKSEEEIAQISEPKISYAFMADGIAIEKMTQTNEIE
jgi:hypothetical protein